MKKTIITMAIVLGLTMTTFAQKGGGVFQRGATPEEESYGGTRDNPALVLPSSHGQATDQNSPLGSGIAVFMGLGAAYLVRKKRKEN